jgi:hypothetical protein
MERFDLAGLLFDDRDCFGTLAMTWRAGVVAGILGALMPGAVAEPVEATAALRQSRRAGMQARLATDGQVDITEDGKPVLRYNYRTIEPGERLKQIAAPNLIYARARSNYIHPLYGFDGEELTADLPIDHPHHRGIYWAWPETKYGDKMGDLHALQIVFARPTGKLKVRSGTGFAEVQAESLWQWEDREPIVRELATIRAHRSTPQGRFIDLTFRMEALKDGVSLARRGTNAYGGLNMRMNANTGQKIAFHTDAQAATPRAAWAEMHATFSGGKSPTGVVTMQHPGNPDFPGDWVQYPELNWFQPTFPAANTRYELKPGKPLTLRWRLWIHPGEAAAEDLCREMWNAYAKGKTPR